MLLWLDRPSLHPPVHTSMLSRFVFEARQEFPAQPCWPPAGVLSFLHAGLMVPLVLKRLSLSSASRPEPLCPPGILLGTSLHTPNPALLKPRSCLLLSGWQTAISRRRQPGLLHLHIFNQLFLLWERRVQQSTSPCWLAGHPCQEVSSMHSGTLLQRLCQGSCPQSRQGGKVPPTP